MSDKDIPTDPDAKTMDVTADITEEKSLPEASMIPVSGMPSEIGRYKILGVIGQGGMGYVYEAMQEAPRRRVALKVIKAGGASEMALRRFQFETQVLAKLQHPNIAQIYEAGTWESPDGEVPFFAMEYIPGTKTIVEYAKSRELSTKDILQLFNKVCDAVHHGHQKGIIHRDLKPDNILVDSIGVPKIIDFGVARATDADLAVTTMQTTMGQLVGTLQYMSPEQCDADPNQIDTRSDVYALGVVLFQLLSGKLPYNLRKQAIHEAVRVIQEERPVSMGTISGSLKGDVDTITLKAIEKDRERRYQSAAELANDINRFLNNEPIIARPISITYQLKMFTKKYKRTCAATLLLSISIVLGAIGTSWGMVEAKRGWAEADRQLERVQEKNAALGQSVTSLLSGVKDVVMELGDSAEAQRALLDLARDNIDAIQEDQPPSPSEQADLAAILLHNAISNMSISAVGYGNLNEAEKSLIEAGETLDSIDISSIEDERLIRMIERMKLDRHKYLAELANSRAYESTDEKISNNFFKQALDSWNHRSKLGRAYHEKTNDWKGKQVEWSSKLGIGNMQLARNNHDLAKEAYTSALEPIEFLVMEVPDQKTRWQRGIAITCYSIARVSEPKDAILLLDRGIKLARTVMKAESSNVRRPRDLALMLSLRGKNHIESGNDIDAGVKDFKEAASMLTRRALESPREAVTQQDFQEQFNTIVLVLHEAGQPQEAYEICTDAIDQLECIASAGSLTGSDTWLEILDGLRLTIEYRK